MFRTGRYIILLLILSVTLVSCSKENPARFRQHLEGTWLLNSFDGTSVPLNEYTVFTFDQMSFSTKGKIECYGIKTFADTSNGLVYHKWDKNNLSYDLYCCDMRMEGTLSGLFGYTTPIEIEREYNYISSTDSTIEMELVYYAMGGTEAPKPYSYMAMDKLLDIYDVADSLYGVWQFKTKNGEDYSNCRIQFLPEKKLNFEFRVGENEWEFTSAEDYYNLYEDFLAITVRYNSEFGVANTWGVTCFRIKSLKQAASLVLATDTDTYTLSFISPN